MDTSKQESARVKRRKQAQQNQAAKKGSSQEFKRNLYHCNYCSKDTSNTPRIKCAICPDFDLCLECFSVGVEIHPHKSDHDYRVVDNLSFPIFHPDWGADEECLLLEAIDMYGLGNWPAVSDHVGSGKTPDQCKTHYFAVYIDVDTYPLPMPAPEMANLPPEMIAGLSAQGRLAHAASKQQLVDAEVRRQGGTPPPDAFAATAPAAIKAEQGGSAALGPDSKAEVHVKAEAMEVDGAAVKEETGTGAAKAEGGVEGMDVDGVAPLEGEHLSEGQIAAAMGAKRQRKAAEASAPEPSAPAEAHATAAKGRTLHAAPAGEEPSTASEAAAAHAHGPSTAPEASDRAPAIAGASAAAEAPSEPVATSAAAAGAAAAAAALDSGRPRRSARPKRKGNYAEDGEEEEEEEGGGQGTGGQAAAGGNEPTAAHPQSTYHHTSNAQSDSAMGFHAKRYEFDPEYDQDAEIMIADMEFSELDTEEDRALKLRILEIYNKRLDAREARRDFLRDHGLLSMRKVQALERRRSAAERETHARLRVFARYSSPQEHDELVEGLLLEQRLRSRLQELAEHRRLGLRTQDEVDAFESEQRRKRSQAQSQAALGSLLAPLGASSGTQDPTSAALSVAAAAAAGIAASSEAAATQLEGGAGGLLDTGLGPARMQTPGPSGADAGGYGAGDLLSPGVNPLTAPLPGSLLLGDLLNASANADGKDAEAPAPAAAATAPPPGGNKGAAAALAAWRARRGVALDISCLPGVELLSAKERELCATARLLPAHYLALKDLMLRDASKNGTITRAEARTYFRLDPARCLRLYDLWVASGWVTGGSKKESGTAKGGADGDEGEEDA